MSSRREVLIRILALLQRKTLIETKSHIKMLKTAQFDCAINEKCCSVDGGRGICPLFSSPPQGFWQLKSPHTREFTIQGKTILMPGGQPGRGGGGWGWEQLELTDALFEVVMVKSQFSDPKWNLLNWFSDSRANSYLWTVVSPSYLARNVTQFHRPVWSFGFKYRRIPAVSKAHLLEFYGIWHLRDWNMAQFVSQCQ